MYRVINFIQGTVFCCLVVLFLGICGNIENRYELKGVIENIEDDVITVCDIRGYEWEFIGDNFSVGDKVEIKFFNNCTEHKVTDDEVIKVKKIVDK